MHTEQLEVSYGRFQTITLAKEGDLSPSGKSFLQPREPRPHLGCHKSFMKIFTPTFRDKECCPEPCKLQKQSLTIASCFSSQGAEEATHQGMSLAKVSQEADCYLNILDS